VVEEAADLLDALAGVVRRNEGRTLDSPRNAWVNGCSGLTSPLRNAIARTTSS
jgi:hypothetical protein